MVSTVAPQDNKSWACLAMDLETLADTCQDSQHYPVRRRVRISRPGDPPILPPSQTCAPLCHPLQALCGIALCAYEGGTSSGRGGESLTLAVSGKRVRDENERSHDTACRQLSRSLARPLTRPSAHSPVRSLARPLTRPSARSPVGSLAAAEPIVPPQLS
jgi:hypothetical protein